jgi:hypothetical protein
LKCGGNVGDGVRYPVVGSRYKAQEPRIGTRGKKNLTKDTMLFLGIEMAGRTKNATPKFFPRVVPELPYKEIGGEGRGPKAEDFF